MEEEINYIDGRIINLEHEIDVYMYALKNGMTPYRPIAEVEKERDLLENILNYITQKEMEQ